MVRTAWILYVCLGVCYFVVCPGGRGLTLTRPDLTRLGNVVNSEEEASGGSLGLPTHFSYESPMLADLTCMMVVGCVREFSWCRVEDESRNAMAPS